MLPVARFMFESGSSLEKLVLSGGIEPQKRDGLLETVGLGAYAGGIEICETPECVDGDAARRCIRPAVGISPLTSGQTSTWKP